MPPGSIFADKELARSYQPLLLIEITHKDGVVSRFSTHPLSNLYAAPPASGSYEYGGFEWVPRALVQELTSVQTMSDLGVDVVPSASITLADPDKTLFALELAKGFKGAKLRLHAVMWDAGDRQAGSFSTGIAPIKFIGTCTSPSFEEKTFTITATSLLGMMNTQMPPIRIQPKCGWSFPPNAAARAEASLENSGSVYQECGYSFGHPGGVGNSDAGNAFTSCGYTFENCIERLGDYSPQSGFVPIEKDQAGNLTGRFGGFRWIPNQSSGMQRSFLTGKWEEIINASNEAKNGDFVPMCYGTTWVEPLVMGMWTSGDYTYMEVLIGYGIINKIRKLVVNGQEVSRNSADTFPSDAVTYEVRNGWWGTVNRGYRNGKTNNNAGWGQQGDPYGSLCCIYVSVLRSVAQEGSIPQIQALVEGQHIRVYTAESTFAHQYSSNPAWILLDLLIWSSWKYADIDVPSFIAAAAKCDKQIYFDRMDGTYSNIYLESAHPIYKRYEVGFSIRQRTAVGEVIRGVRAAMKGMLYFDFNNGKLHLQVKETVASQQNTPITGSNYNTPIPSVSVEGAALPGYVAYKFDGSNIRKMDGRSTLRIRQKINQDAPNRMAVQFQNRENSYSQDTATIVDVEDIERYGKEMSGGSLTVLGTQTFDHTRRVVLSYFAECYRGNPRFDYEGSAIGDTGGTLVFELETTVKVIHLTVGHLCLITDEQHGIDNQLVRVDSIEPSTNFEFAKVTLAFHNDNWYQDSYGQISQPIYTRARSIVDRAPFSWRPDEETPVTGDVYWGTRRPFGLAQFYETAGDSSSLAKIQITGKVPVNTFPNTPGRPKLELTGTGTTGGGYPSNRTYYVGLAAKKDATTASLMSPISKMVVINLQPPNNALAMVVQNWPDKPVGFFAFVGLHPLATTFQGEYQSNPVNVVLSNTFNEASWGAPDEAFSNFRWKVRRAVHAGIFGQEIVSVTSNSIKVSMYANYGFNANQLAGREISVLGIKPIDPGKPTFVPLANFLIASNTADTFTLAAGNPTTCVNGSSLKFGDVVTVRMLPVYGENTQGKYFEDLQLINALNSTGTVYNVLGATNTSPIKISIGQKDAAFPYVNNDHVVIQQVQGNLWANGGWTIANCDPALGTFTLVGSVGSGNYTTGGKVALQYQGVIPSAEKGYIAFIIAGTGAGTYVKIKDNTSTRYYIDGDWPVFPDATSRIIILEPTIQVDVVTGSINNNTPRARATYDVDVSNYLGKTIFVQAVVQSTNGLESNEYLDPFRELYMFGDGTALMNLIGDSGGGASNNLKVIPISNIASTQLSSLDGDQFIDVTATTTDVVIILPNEEEMIGHTVTVHFNVQDNGHRIFVKPFQDADTIEGSTGDVTLSIEGEQRSWAGAE